MKKNQIMKTKASEFPQLPGEAEESNQRPNNEDVQAKVMQGALAHNCF